MKYDLPPEISALDRQINALATKREEIYSAWINSVAPFKSGQKVKITKGKITRPGTVLTPILEYGDSWRYQVKMELKNGTYWQALVYPWEKIEAA